MDSRIEAIKDYKREIGAIKKINSNFLKAAMWLPQRLIRGRVMVHIEEVITYYETCLYALENGADPKAFNYLEKL